MRTLERTYSKSERIVVRARFSCWVFMREVLIALVLGGALAAVWLFADKIEGAFTDGAPVAHLTQTNLKWALLGCGLFVVLLTLLHAVSLYSRELVVTDDKLIYRQGASSVVNVILPLALIVNVEMHQSATQRLLHIGNIMIISDMQKPLVIKNVVRPDRLGRRIMRQSSAVRNAQESKQLRLRIAPADYQSK